MKKIVLLALVLVLLSVSMFGTRLVITASGSTIRHVYPGDSIQDAINSAQSGDTIFVHNGTYYEHVVVNKTVSLVGEDKYNTIIDGNSTGTVMNVTTSNVNITGFTIQNSGFPYCGIYVYGATGNNISYNILTNNCDGIYLSASFNCTVSGNNASNNYFGIALENSFNCTVSSNDASNNRNDGIYLQYSDNCTVSGNTISLNTNGIHLEGRTGIWQWGHNNTFFHNNFINNFMHAYSYNSTNVWDDGYPSGGNYWSNYNVTDLYSGPNQNETGSDGIGDTQYVIDSDNRDRYPLIAPYTPLSVSWNGKTYSLNVSSNSTITEFSFTQPNKTVSFKVGGPDGTAGFCNITIPNSLVQDLWQGNFTVLVDGEQPIVMNNWTDGTYTYIYLTYLHSTHKVDIIPEFPTWTSILLLLMVLTVAIIICKRRLLKTPIH